MRRIIFAAACLMIAGSFGCSLPFFSPSHPTPEMLYKDIPLGGGASEREASDTMAVGSQDSGAAVIDGLRAKPALSLDECLILGIANSDNLANQNEFVIQSLQNKLRAYGALLPQLSLMSKYQQNSSPVLMGKTVFVEESSFEYWLTAKLPIFVGLRDWTFIRQSDLDIQSRKTQMAYIRDQVISVIGESFFGVLKAEKDLAVTQTSLERAKAHLKKIVARAEVGEAKKSERLLAESMVAGLEYAITRANFGVTVARDRLGVLLGFPVTAKLEYAEFPSRLPSSFEDALALAMANRQDIVSSKLKADSACEGVKMVLGEYLPTVMLQYDYNLERAGYMGTLDWTMTVVGEMPIFEGGLKKAKLNEAESRARQAQIAYSQLMKEVRFDVHRSFLEVDAINSSLNSLRKQVDSSKANYELVQEEYNEGLSTNLEVLIANESLSNAQAQLEKEILNLQLAAIKLMVSTGTVSPVLGDRR